MVVVTFALLVVSGDSLGERNHRMFDEVHLLLVIRCSLLIDLEAGTFNGVGKAILMLLTIYQPSTNLFSR